MPPAKFGVGPHSETLVLAVNEAYHDLEGDGYASIHPEIFQDEIERWKRLGEQYVASVPGKRNILDYGCGTGFVGMQLKELLTPDDMLTCMDVSQIMLDSSRKNLSAIMNCNLHFVKTNGIEIPLEAATFDVVAVNSVVHHIPDYRVVLARLSAVVKSGGRLIIVHEPNNRLYRSAFLSFAHAAAKWLRKPRIIRRSASAALRLLGILHAVKSLLRIPTVTFKAGFYDALNSRIMAKGAINRPLSSQEIAEILDIHLCRTGRSRSAIGLDPDDVAKSAGGGWHVEWFESYGHLGIPASSKYSVANLAEKILVSVFPKSGPLFAMVLKKSS